MLAVDLAIDADVEFVLGVHPPGELVEVMQCVSAFTESQAEKLGNVCRAIITPDVQLLLHHPFDGLYVPLNRSHGASP